MLFRSKKLNTLSEIDVNGSVVSNPNLLAKTFNDFFTNIGSNLAKKIPPSNVDPISFLKGDYPNSLFFNPVTEQEIIQIIGNLKNTSSKGYDDIPVNVLKFCRNELATVLSHINNLSFGSGVFPNVLKIAKVLPIYKNGDKKNSFKLQTNLFVICVF